LTIREEAKVSGSDSEQMFRSVKIRTPTLNSSKNLKFSAYKAPYNGLSDSEFSNGGGNDSDAAFYEAR